jgi:hypothetical protein
MLLVFKPLWRLSKTVSRGCVASVMNRLRYNMEDIMQPPPTEHQHTPDEERRIREAALDQTIAESFPASDPLSSDPNPDDHSALDPDAADDQTNDRGSQ